jgi:lysozyme family protein
MKSVSQPAAGLLSQLKTSVVRQIVIDSGSVDRAVMVLKKYLNTHRDSVIGERTVQMIQSLRKEWSDVNVDELRNLEMDVVDAMISLLRANLGGVLSEAQLQQILDR